MQFQEEQDYNKRFDLNLWKRLLYYARPFYKYLVGVALCMMCSALMDTVFPLMNRYAIDTFVAQGSLDGIGGFAAAYIGFVLFATAYASWRSRGFRSSLSPTMTTLPWAT